MSIVGPVTAIMWCAVWWGLAFTARDAVWGPLRARRVLTCRSASRLLLAWAPVEIFVWAAGMQFLWPNDGPFLLAAVKGGLWLVVVQWICSHQGFPFPLRDSWRKWREHHGHDIDCEHGPKPRYATAPRLRTWRKVALRPEFTPA